MSNVVYIVCSRNQIDFTHVEIILVTFDREKAELVSLDSQGWVEEHEVE